MAVSGWAIVTLLSKTKYWGVVAPVGNDYS